MEGLEADNIGGFNSLLKKQENEKGEALAVGGAIHHIGNVHKYIREEDCPEKTMFVIITDGMENASYHYNKEQVKKMIEEKQEKYGWEFLFLGANIDAAETAGHLGIARNRAVDFHCDSVGTQLNYDVVSETISHVRATQSVPETWAGAIMDDYNKRG